MKAKILLIGFVIGLTGLLMTNPSNAQFKELQLIEFETNVRQDINNALHFFEDKDAVTRFRDVELNDNLKSLSTIEINDFINLNLFSDAEYIAEVQRVDEILEDNVTITAKLINYDFAYAFVSTTYGRTLVNIHVPEQGKQYKITSDPVTLQHYLIEIDPSALPEFEDLPYLIPPDPTSEELEEINRIQEQLENTRSGPSDPATIDVMIIYTTAARIWGNDHGGGIHNRVASAVAYGNTALSNSATIATIRLVRSAEITYTEYTGPSIWFGSPYNFWASGPEVDLIRLTEGTDGFASAHTWRNTYGADLVQLFTTMSGGVAWVLNNTGGQPAYGYSLAGVSTATGHVPIHEMGHNMGCGHHKQQNFQPGPGLYTYSAGWRWQGTNNVWYNSVMSYSAAGFFPTNPVTSTTVAHFSNPSVNFMGVATGHATDGDNARTIRNTKHVVAAYRSTSTIAGMWTGSISSDWHDPMNWLNGQLPTTSVDVTIPANTPHSPIIYGGDAYCKNLVVEWGATLTQNSPSYFWVHGHFDPAFGQFIMTGTTSYLYFGGSTNTLWYNDNGDDIYTNVRVNKASGYSMTMMHNTTCSGNFRIMNGILVLNENTNLTLLSMAFDAFRIENNGVLSLSTARTLNVSGGIVFFNGSQANVTGGTIRCGGNFRVEENTSHNIALTNATLIMNGTGNQYIQDLDGGSLQLHHLTINKSGGTVFIANANLNVNGNILISNGKLSCFNGPSPTASYNIDIKGNWTNNNFPAGFEAGNGRVIFSGPGHQYVYSSENFNILEANMGNALRINHSSRVITCNQYHWTAGGIDVIAGTFTALDLAQTSLRGGFWVNAGATINLHQSTDWGHYVDLGCSMVFSGGGTINVYGGEAGSNSWWPAGTGSITMSGGVLDFKDQGINVLSGGTLTTNITGGTIRTSSGFICSRPEFTPTAGTFEFYGSGNYFISQTEGSLHHVNISKGASREGEGESGKPVYDSRSGGLLSDGGRSGTITLNSDFAITGNLNINSGTFSLGAYNCDVAGNLNVYGTLSMPHTSSRSLNAFGNVVWFAGSSANMSSSSHIEVYGDWNFNAGSNVDINNGFVNFRGSNLSWIRSYSGNSNFHNLRVFKASGFPVNFSNLSTHDLVVNGYIHLSSTSALNSYSNQNIILRGNFNFHGTYDFTLINNTGSLIFDGNSQMIYNYGPGSGVFNNVVINSTAGTTISNGDITIAGNLTIDQGSLSPGTNMINIAGNWTNNNFPAGFVPGTGRVVFNGSGNQYIHSNENFNILEANLGGNIRVNNVAYTVTCNQYDWTAGGIEVQTGTFTASDLAQEGLFGAYRVNTGGTINLTNSTGGTWVDLIGSIYNYGGTMNISGTIAWWPFADGAHLTMTGGVIDIKTCGLRIHSGYTWSYNITGGTIRTAYSYTGARTDFNPTAGTFEFYGTANATISQNAGNTLHIVVINKSDSRDGEDEAEITLYDKRSGELLSDGGRSGAISLNSNFMITNNLIVESGTLNISGHELTVNKVADIYGTLNMANSTAVLNVGTLPFDNLRFFNGSSGNFSNGNVYLKSWISIETGVSFFASTDNTIHIIGSNLGGGLANDEPTALFGNVVINKTANPCFFSSSRTGPYNIQGDFTIHANNIFQTGGKPAKISGYFNNDPTSSTLLYYNQLRNDANLCSSDTRLEAETREDNFRSGVLEIESDFELHGLLDVGPGSVLVKQGFDLSVGSTLTISGGSFINSKAYTDVWTNLWGTLNMTSGLFELTYNHPNFRDVSNVSGGIIRTGGAFGAETAEVFKPTGGTVEITGSGLAGAIRVHSGNYFHNLVINRSGLYSGFDQVQPLIINNNFHVNNGRISSLWSEINVHGNVVVNDGGTLEITGLGSLLLSASKSLTINSGGILDLTGNITNQPKISRISSGHYAFNVESGGTIAAEYALFEYMNSNGINIKPGAIVDHSKAFHNCTFRLGQSGGRLLTINNSQTLAVNYASFPTNTWGGNFNVSKTVNAGVVNFMGYGGDFSGATYEQDPNSRIHWGGQTAANITLQGVEIVPGQDICFEATNTLTVGGGGSIFKVHNGGFVDLVAGQKIRMLEGTHAHHGANLHARITTSGDYCSLPSSLIAVIDEVDIPKEVDMSSERNLFFKVYPNPTTGMFNLELAQATSALLVEIYSLMGERIFMQEVSGYQLYEFDLSQQPRGIYIIRVLSGEKMGVERVIRQ